MKKEYKDSFSINNVSDDVIITFLTIQSTSILPISNHTVQLRHRRSPGTTKYPRGITVQAYRHIAIDTVQGARHNSNSVRVSVCLSADVYVCVHLLLLRS